MTFTNYILIFQLVGLSLTVDGKAKDKRSDPDPSFAKRFEKAALASDTPVCSTLGKNILKENGSAVDAAIAGMLCIATVNFQSTGIGGGGYMTVFDKKSKKVIVIDFRETTPSGISNEDNFTRGAKSIGVPGMLRGFEVAHRRFGRLPWKKLFESVAELAEKGFPITKALIKSYQKRKRMATNNNYWDLKEFSAMRDFLKDLEDPQKLDFKFKNPALAHTYRVLGDAGNSDSFYKGKMSKEIIRLITESGGTMTTNDLKNYKPIIREPIVLKLGDNTLYSPPPPAGGVTMSSILGILDGYNFTSRDLENLKDEMSLTHKMVEAMKWSYAKSNILNDPDYFEMTSSNETHGGKSKKTLSRKQKLFGEIHRFLDENHFKNIRKRINNRPFSEARHYEQDGVIGVHHGTTHLSVLSPEGDAVALTTSINNYFGSLIFSKTLGFPFNDQLSDFKPVASRSFVKDEFSGFLVKGKRPFSYMCPSIVLNSDGDVSMVIGASGSTKIPSVEAQVFVNYFWLNMDLKSSIERLRVHSQLVPDYLFVEKKFPKQKWNALENLGYNLTNRLQIITRIPHSPFAVCQVIGVKDRTRGFPIEAVSDPRKQGQPDGF